ncbi:ActS/PrrB/RegB family redox-sensitive histidine kinase, partial [Paracoccaceae bacterium]|nr:ActS/PrrB/RegB family redox-sensitive histidine kinase [Paracoccaceae bacterium]
WLAIFGQVVAISFVYFFLDFYFNFYACLIIILFSFFVNLLSQFYFGSEKRLTSFKTFIFLTFDLIQISVLLYFSGGISNPFSILMIVPVIVSASSLPIVFVIYLGVMTVTSIIFLSFVYTPIYQSAGYVLKPPDILLLGFSLSLIITVTFLGAYARRVSSDNENMNKALQVAQAALERERKLTALSGVVAALGHELGSPLATIKLASSELLNELDLDNPVYPDVKLIYEQSERCKSIIADMGELGKDDQYVKINDLMTILFEACEPFKNFKKTINFKLNNKIYGYEGNYKKDINVPLVRREPELLHGIRNLVHNAIKFSNSTVNINLIVEGQFITIEITDDGQGFPENLLRMIGDPFLKSKKNFLKDTDPKKGMGLGLFISKILLERTNGRVNFSNIIQIKNKYEKNVKGAKVEIMWEKASIEVSNSLKKQIIKENPRNVD